MIFFWVGLNKVVSRDYGADVGGQTVQNPNQMQAVMLL